MLQALHPDPDEATLLQVIRPEEFERQSHRAFEEGLEVEDDVWHRLKQLAGRTLVEATEESRAHGAGEGAD